MCLCAPHWGAVCWRTPWSLGGTQDCFLCQGSAPQSSQPPLPPSIDLHQPPVSPQNPAAQQPSSAAYHQAPTLVSTAMMLDKRQGSIAAVMAGSFLNLRACQVKQPSSIIDKFMPFWYCRTVIGRLAHPCTLCRKNPCPGLPQARAGPQCSARCAS